MSLKSKDDSISAVKIPHLMVPDVYSNEGVIS